MADDTHTPTVGTEPEVKAIRWCHWHGDVTDTGVLIDAQSTNSGPPRPFYACAPCRKRHRLVPLSEQPQ
ncbi:hypothetical protein ACIOKD_14140 [Streptomyces sp. NPDC087844]|uniref:hypothetical protein n=1 Tax=Streptomyces sp. NPDC087844 TaxID=3365805 RepID=UPI0037F26ED7